MKIGNRVPASPTRALDKPKTHATNSHRARRQPEIDPGIGCRRMKRNIYATLEDSISLKDDLKRMLLGDYKLRSEYGDVGKKLAGQGG